MHSSKSRAKGVSASSFFDLKAELSKKEEVFARDKAAGKSTIVGGVQRPDKKPTVWARQNKGVKARASRDVELEAISKPTLESARAALERKAKIYEKLQKGKSGGLNDKQYDALLVDFDSKRIGDSWESDSDDLDESLTVPRPENDEDDPIIEYEDEFGRVRTAPRSEVPRELLPHSNEDENNDDDEDIIIRNPVNHFPVYEPSAERIAQIAKEHAEENNPLGLHYDASKEVRAKGAGFYQFSADEETRKTQMEELKAARKETGAVRRETGAVDVKPGEVEGMHDEDSVATTKSRALEKRKREIEERRKLVEAKRRKVKGVEGTQQAPSEGPPMFVADDRNTPGSNPAKADPFAALETASAFHRPQSKGKGKAPVSNEADDFLAQLESEMFKRKAK